jgi:hypothetical protein
MGRLQRSALTFERTFHDPSELVGPRPCALSCTVRHAGTGPRADRSLQRPQRPHREGRHRRLPRRHLRHAGHRRRLDRQDLLRRLCARRRAGARRPRRDRKNGGQDRNPDHRSAGADGDRLRGTGRAVPRALRGRERRPRLDRAVSKGGREPGHHRADARSQSGAVLRVRHQQDRRQQREGRHDRLGGVRRDDRPDDRRRARRRCGSARCAIRAPMSARRCGCSAAAARAIPSACSTAL